MEFISLLKKGMQIIISKINMKLIKSILKKIFFWKRIKEFRKYSDLRREIRLRSSNLRIVVGSSGVFDDGWLPTDINMLDILNDSDWHRLFKKHPLKSILAEHVWEHLNEQESIVAAKNCYNYLQKKGYLRIAVPDGFHPDPDYINYVKIGGIGAGADDHKVLYTYKTVRNTL